MSYPPDGSLLGDRFLVCAFVTVLPCDRQFPVSRSLWLRMVLLQYKYATVL